MRFRLAVRALVLTAPLFLTFQAALAGPPIYLPPPKPAVEPTAAPSPTPGKPARYRLLVLDLKGNDVDKATVATLQSVVAADLARYPELDVVSGEDVKQLVQLQAERSSMGCSEDASCLAEIADALGAQLVVFGNAGRLGNSIVVNINLFDSVRAAGLGRVVVQVEGVKQLPKKLAPKLRDLLARFYEEKGLTLPPPPPAEVAEAPERGPGAWPWIVAGTGGALLLGGAAVATVGSLSLIAFQQEKGRVQALEQQFVDDGDLGHAQAAQAAQTDLRAARDSWNSLGVYLFDIGVPLAAVGLFAGSISLVWGVASAPDEDALPPRPADGATQAPSPPSAAGGGA